MREAGNALNGQEGCFFWWCSSTTEESDVSRSSSLLLPCLRLRFSSLRLVDELPADEVEA